MGRRTLCSKDFICPQLHLGLLHFSSLCPPCTVPGESLEELQPSVGQSLIHWWINSKCFVFIYFFIRLGRSLHQVVELLLQILQHCPEEASFLILQGEPLTPFLVQYGYWNARVCIHTHSSLPGQIWSLQGNIIYTCLKEENFFLNSCFSLWNEHVRLPWRVMFWFFHYVPPFQVMPIWTFHSDLRKQRSARTQLCKYPLC